MGKGELPDPPRYRCLLVGVSSQLIMVRAGCPLLIINVFLLACAGRGHYIKACTIDRGSCSSNHFHTYQASLSITPTVFYTQFIFF